MIGCLRSTVRLAGFALLCLSPVFASVKSSALNPTGNTWLYWVQPDSNMKAWNPPGESPLRVTALNQAVTLLNFSLQGISAKTAIKSATLTLTVVDGSDPSTYDVGTYLGLKTFNDAQATYKQAATGVNWSTPGLAAGVDYCVKAGCRGVRLKDGATTKTIDVAALVTGALQQGFNALPLVLKYEGVGYGGVQMASTRSAKNSQWPVLTIVLDSTSPIANPGPSPAFVTVWAPVPLDASSSARPDGSTTNLVFKWTLTGKPTDSRGVIGSQVATGKKTTMPVDVPGTYKCLLTVSDPTTGESGTAPYEFSIYRFASHPRIGLNAAMVAQIQGLAKIQSPIWIRFQDWIISKQKGSTAYTYVGSDGVGFALYYAVTHDRTVFQMTWNYYLPLIYNNGNPSSGTRPFFGACGGGALFCDDHSAASNGGPVIAELAKFYDWCYDALTPAQRADIIKILNAGTTYNYLTNSVGHAHFRNDGTGSVMGLAVAGFATLGENPGAPQILSWFNSCWSETLSALDVMGMGGAMAEGNAYGEVSAGNLIETAHTVFYASGLDLFQSHPFFKKRLMYDAFATYPNSLGGPNDPVRVNWAPIVEGSVGGGDDQRGVSFHTLGMRPHGLALARHFQGTPEANTWEWVFRQPNSDTGFDAWYEVYYYYPVKPVIKPTVKSFFDPSLGYVYVRSDWDSSDATLISSWAGPHLDVHQHLDQGAFTVFKRRDLADTTGNYDAGSAMTPHSFNWNTRTIASNGLLIGDPQETFGGFNGFVGCDASNHFTFMNSDGSASLCPVNDGGQRTMSPQSLTLFTVADYTRYRNNYNTASVLSFHDTGKFVTWVSDITNAYSNPQQFMPMSRPKVKRVVRKFAYLRDFDLLIVGDAVESTDPSFEKSWLLHSVDQLQVGGSVQTIDAGESVHTNTTAAKVVVDDSMPSNTGQLTADYRTRYAALLVQTVFPKSPVLRVIGGRVPAATAHAAQGQSNPAVLQDNHLHTHIKDFWVKDYSQGYQADHQSANWAPVYPTETIWSIDAPSMIGGFGRWRLQVQPSVPSTQDYFLHVLQPSLDPKAANVASTPVEDGSHFGVTLKSGGKTVTVSFTKTTNEEAVITSVP